MLKSSLLFFKKLLTNLVSCGFTVIPYDPCVVTKTIIGKQMKIFWHVDDLKLFHEVLTEVTRVKKWLRGIYNKILVSRGKKYTYLGM